MYRRVSEEYQPLLRHLSTEICRRFPRVAHPLRGSQFFVPILTPQYVERFEAKRQTGGVYTETFMETIYGKLGAKSHEPTQGTCATVDVLGNTLALILDAPVVADEIVFAYTALWDRLKRQPTQLRAPYMAICRVESVGSTTFTERMIDVSANECALYLPEDRQLTLQAVALNKPKPSNYQP